MKKMILAILALVSTNVHAFDFGCVTEHPSTTFIAQTVDDYVQFQLIHHNGVKYAPVWNRLITLNDISIVKEKAQLLAEIGDHLKFAMPAKNCQMNGVQMNCFGTQAPIEMNGHKVSLWSVYTVESEESSYVGNYSYISTEMALDIDGKTVIVPMKYADYECYSGLEKNPVLKKYIK